MPIVLATPSSVIDLLVKEPALRSLGYEPSAGFIDVHVLVPPSSAKGRLSIEQAVLSPVGGGGIRRTNSAPAIVR